MHAKLLQLCLTLFSPMDWSPPDSSVYGNSSGLNTGGGCHALLQGIFPTQGLISSLLTSPALAAQFSSVAQLYPTLCDPMDCSMPGFLVYHQIQELAQIYVHWVGDAIQPFHLLSSPSPPAFNLSQHQGLFQWVSSLHQVAKVLELQFQHQSFQWIFRTHFL